MKATGRFCKKHGGDVEQGCLFLCDACARAGINPCKCGSPARAFGEAAMSSISCESCDQFLMGIWVNHIREKWTAGERGVLPDGK